ncbi:hypothetical protein BD779DRAFT_1681577 [Infundibulicybe gibba]|nr:hypothetical protein BD779DRAFT_1681577 [Infundibulicybe gibba]
MHISDIMLGQVVTAIQALAVDPSSAPATPCGSGTLSQSNHHDAPTPPNTPAKIRINRPTAHEAHQESNTAWYAVTRGRAVGVVKGWETSGQYQGVAMQVV